MLESVRDDDEQPRGRRSRHEVQRLILDAARQVFAEKGYAGATTREIAERADVHESMVSRRFATKIELFEAAVQVPFDEVISQYLATWEAQVGTPAGMEDLTRAFVEPLYLLLSEHRELTFALIKSQSLPADTADAADTADTADTEQGAIQNLVLRIVDRMQHQYEIEENRRHLRGATTSTVLASVGMITGVALLDQAFIDDQPGLSRRQLADEMINLLVYGTLPRAEPPTPGTDDTPSAMTRELLDRLLETERRATTAELELARLRNQMEQQDD